MRNIIYRRILELTVRVISFFFALEILFTLLYFFCFTQDYNPSYRKLLFYIENATGITVITVNALSLIFSLFLTIKDKKFPLGPFFLSIAEGLISAIFILFIQVIEVTIFQGVTIAI